MNGDSITEGMVQGSKPSNSFVRLYNSENSLLSQAAMMLQIEELMGKSVPLSIRKKLERY